jgi:hypothetical protein
MDDRGADRPRPRGERRPRGQPSAVGGASPPVCAGPGARRVAARAPAAHLAGAVGGAPADHRRTRRSQDRASNARHADLEASILSCRGRAPSVSLRFKRGRVAPRFLRGVGRHDRGPRRAKRRANASTARYGQRHGNVSLARMQPQRPTTRDPVFRWLERWPHTKGHLRERPPVLPRVPPTRAMDPGIRTSGPTTVSPGPTEDGAAEERDSPTAGWQDVSDALEGLQRENRVSRRSPE